MATKRKFKSDMSEAIHSSAAALYKVGAIDKTTMADFDARHLVPRSGNRAPSGPAPHCESSCQSSKNTGSRS
jgi:hypothetical protein